MKNQKIYKPIIFGVINMIPGDFSRLPDEFFLSDELIGGHFYG
tara:strand:- start:686 stop:814 length:129 start_codon:yes stop_codon:yes gene_type:complete